MKVTLKTLVMLNTEPCSTKDVKGFQEQYYGPNGAGLKNISGQKPLQF